MVVAKNDAAHQELSRQFHDREVEKEYIALVWGVVQAGKRIDAPIGRDPQQRQKMSTRARRARSAVTRVTWARHLHGVSLLQGRDRHRPHASDPRAPERHRPSDRRRLALRRRAPARARRPARRAALERPFLHAARLAFTHPRDGRRVEFDSPLPPDLQAVLDDIEARSEPADGGVV